MPDWNIFEEYAQMTMEQLLIPGMAVAVARDGEIIYAKGFGLRDRQSGAKVDPETLFGIASVSKSFTCVGIMQLAEAGRLSVDDPVTQHLPEFRIGGVDWVDEIRIRHLMSHTSGLPPLPGLGYALRKSMKAYPRWDDAKPEPDQAKDEKDEGPDMSTFGGFFDYLAAEKPEMLGRPGDYLSYSNDGYLILGAIIERVSGQNYYDYMDEHVFGAIGLVRTSFRVPAAEPDPEGHANVTRLYFHNIRRETKDVPRWQHLQAYDPAGGIRSTALDLAAYGQMYARGGVSAKGQTVISGESIGTMLQPAYQIGRRAHYGFGLEAVPGYAGAYTLAEHGGSLTGVSSRFGFVSEAGLSVAVLTNVSNVPAADIWLALTNTALGLPLEQKRSVEPTDYSPPPGYLDRFTGTYKSGEGANLSIGPDGNGGLKVEIAGEEFPLRPTDGQTLAFHVRTQERLMRFHTRPDGEVWAVFTGLRMIRRAPSAPSEKAAVR